MMSDPKKDRNTIPTTIPTVGSYQENAKTLVFDRLVGLERSLAAPRAVTILLHSSRLVILFYITIPS